MKNLIYVIILIVVLIAAAYAVMGYSFIPGFSIWPIIKF